MLIHLPRSIFVTDRKYSVQVPNPVIEELKEFPYNPAAFPARPCVFWFLSAQPPHRTFKKQVIYQIVTDRFFKESTSNDNPSQSSAGDLAGIQQHMSHVKGMGVTAICKIASDGTVTWEGGSNHNYTVPSSGTGL
jgi:hypothetical protein